MTMQTQKHTTMADTTKIIKNKKGDALMKEHGDLFATANMVHHTTQRHCEYCGAPMSPSDVNDYGDLCRRCYERENR